LQLFHWLFGSFCTLEFSSNLWGGLWPLGRPFLLNSHFFLGPFTVQYCTVWQKFRVRNSLAELCGNEHGFAPIQPLVFYIIPFTESSGAPKSLEETMNWPFFEGAVLQSKSPMNCWSWWNSFVIDYWRWLWIRIFTMRRS
jgi:hypothetical protein